MRYGHTEAFIVRAAEGVQELAQVVDQQWHVDAVQAGCCHSSIVELGAAAVGNRVAYYTIHL